MQAALATSVDLRCYMVLSQTVDENVTLDLDDFNHHVKWSLSDLTDFPESNGTILYMYIGYRLLAFSSQIVEC